MNESELFTARETDAAHALMDHARWFAREYAKPEDLEAAVKAVLTLALELTHSRHGQEAIGTKSPNETDSAVSVFT